MEVIFPWERDDIIVRSTAEDSTDEASDGPGFAAMLATLSKEATTEARIQTLADGVRSVASSSEMSTEEVLDRVESILDDGERTDADEGDRTDAE